MAKILIDITEYMEENYTIIQAWVHHNDAHHEMALGTKIRSWANQLNPYKATVNFSQRMKPQNSQSIIMPNFFNMQDKPLSPNIKAFLTSLAEQAIKEIAHKTPSASEDIYTLDL